jgi:hypothetical protein
MNRFFDVAKACVTSKWINPKGYIKNPQNVNMETRV